MQKMNVHTSSHYFAEKHIEILKQELYITDLASKLKFIQLRKIQELSNVLMQLRDKRKRLRKVRLRS